MSDNIWVILQRTLASEYSALKARLGRILGSEELAKEVLHEVYLRLNVSSNRPRIEISKPEAYISRMAINVARDMERDASRQKRKADALNVMNLTQPQANLADEMEAHFRVEDLKAIMAGLPPLRLKILLAVMAEGASHEEIAWRYNISKRAVQRHLRLALDYCLRHAEKK